MKPERNKSKKSNIESYSNTFGDIELRPIQLRDLEFLDGLLKEIKESKVFVVELLHHQLVNPEIPFSKFERLPSEELRGIARDFMKCIKYLFKHFEETTESEFFQNFREAIIKHKEEVNERLYRPILKYFFIPKGEYSKLFKQLIETRERIAETLKPVIAQLLSQKESWQRWIKENEEIFQKYTKLGKKFERRFAIPKEEAFRVLKKYKWFISPQTPLIFLFDVVEIEKKVGNQQNAINKLFVDHYSDNNFIELEKLIEGWEENEVFKSRIKIFRDCVFALKSKRKNYNPSNLVIPTLIAQIEGIIKDFMKRLGLPWEWEWEEPWNRWFKEGNENELYNVANYLLLEILFQKAIPGEPLEIPFTFNRHKILHGEYTNYGRINNTIRAFLILDLLDNISRP